MSFVMNRHYQGFWIMDETTEGTFPAPASPTNAEFVSRLGAVSIIFDIGALSLPALGYRRAAEILGLTKTLSLTLDFNPSIGTGLTFLKRAFNTSGSPSIDTSFSGVLKMESPPGTTTYLKFKNARIERCDLTMRGGGLLTARVIIGCKLHGWDTTAPTNWNLVSDPGEVPIKSKDYEDPIEITVGANTYYPSVRAITLSVDTGLSYIPALGQDSWVKNPSGIIKITGVITLNKQSQEYWGIVANESYATIKWYFSSSKYITLTNAKFDRISIPIDSGGGGFFGGDEVLEALQIIDAKDASLTA